MKYSDKIVVLASDGIWEFLSNEAVFLLKQVLSCIEPYYNIKNPQSACEFLVKEATKHWKNVNIIKLGGCCC